MQNLRADNPWALGRHAHAFEGQEDAWFQVARRDGRDITFEELPVYDKDELVDICVVAANVCDQISRVAREPLDIPTLSPAARSVAPSRALLGRPPPGSAACSSRRRPSSRELERGARGQGAAPHKFSNRTQNRNTNISQKLAPLRRPEPRCTNHGLCARRLRQKEQGLRFQSIPDDALRRCRAHGAHHWH